MVHTHMIVAVVEEEKVFLGRREVEIVVESKKTVIRVCWCRLSR